MRLFTTHPVSPSTLGHVVGHGVLSGRASGRGRLAALALAAAGLASCGNAQAPVVHATNTPTPPPPSIDVTPADGSRDVALDSRITVEVHGGRVRSVTVTADDASSGPPGAVTADGTSWSSNGSLLAGRRYSVDVVAVGSGGSGTSARTTFSTRPATAVTTEMTPGDGQVVGVGMPIVLSFSAPVQEAQQVEFLKHITVSATPPVVGAWHWYTLREAHFRPRDFWASGTTVTVSVDTDGVNAGNGYAGAEHWSRTFTIGEKHVSIIDTAAHTMTVIRGDQTVWTWPTSTGKPGYETIGGTLWVRYRAQVVRMQSCGTFGGAACIPGNPNFYDQQVYWDTAISTDGYFVHAAPWSVTSQGRANVSHGCVNLSPADAETFFHFSQVGDVVQVVHSPKTADHSDGEADWQIPFESYDNSGPRA